MAYGPFVECSPAVPEIRIDPLTGLRAIVATDRAGRPGGELHVAPPEPIDPAADPFAEGHEAQTPPELFAVRPAGGDADAPGWTVRVFPNRYPALTADAPEPPPDPHPALYTALGAAGAHEVIVNSPASVVSLADLPVEQVGAAVEVWRQRMRAHAGAAYAHLCVNERIEAGATQPHTHAQLFVLRFVPAIVARERERFGAYAVRTMGANLLEDLVQEEVRRRERVVAIDDEAVLTCPYASHHAYALMITPRRRRERFEDDGPSGAALLHDALSRLRRLFGASPPLNLWVRTAPRDADRYCWRIDIVPRLASEAGLELGTGVHLNTVAPEVGAARLREV
jgi:UDPglucose--hexose-1-phosphate uridylyltransferase